VALLIAEGLTNREIADRLLISPATVSSHVAHILNKLNISRRSQVAAFTIGRGRQGAVEPPPTEAPRQTADALPRGGLGRLRDQGGLVAIIALALVLMAGAVRWASTDSALPAHGQGLFALDLSVAGAQLSEVILHTENPDQDSIEFAADGVRIDAPAGFPLLIGRGFGVSDFVAEVRARQLSGQNGYAIQFRGCRNDGGEDDDFYRVVVEPQSGAIGIDRARCGPGFTVATLSPTERGLEPLPLAAEEVLTIASQGQTVSVYSHGREVAKGKDPMAALPPGSLRFGVYSPGTVALTGLMVYEPA
jgi:hypothetical protein